MITKNCKRCNKEYQFDETIDPKKRAEYIENYCSYDCKHGDDMRSYAKEYYNKIKDTPEYKSKRKVYFDKWLKKNRSHFNDLCRERSRLIAERKRLEWKTKGLCCHCGNERDVQDRKSCEKCLQYYKVKNSKRQERIMLKKIEQEAKELAKQLKAEAKAELAIQEDIINSNVYNETNETNQTINETNEPNENEKQTNETKENEKQNQQNEQNKEEQ